VTVSEYPPAVPLQEYINTNINSYMDQLDSQVHMKLQQVHRFCLRLNQLVPLLTLANQPIIQRQCGWPCGQNITPSIKLLQPAFVEIRTGDHRFGQSCISIESYIRVFDWNRQRTMLRNRDGICQLSAIEGKIDLVSPCSRVSG